MSCISSPAPTEQCKCPICLMPLGNKNDCVTECGHRFHTSCLLRAAQNNVACPLCRSELVSQPTSHTLEDPTMVYNRGYENGKMESDLESQRIIDFIMCESDQDTIVECVSCHKSKPIKKMAYDVTPMCSEFAGWNCDECGRFG